ncbi:hypothetical protein DMN91_011914 [Ooceraea biroi]|uniref:SprT-like domain-containing protein n=1 Tax=Ooceraea biroi TaxID=2015173 RepID=A0A3L8D7A0_OOCBI|nr:uncharacterized protein LOC105280537 [Ooceraea biroi]RLU16154.1 hypothetical protein DMN91_011914 [Ooceraea biroi]
MISNYNSRNSTGDTENFTLHLSEGSTIEDTQDLVATDKINKRDGNDVIVISDSSSNSSFDCSDILDSKTSNFNIKNKKKTIYPKSNVLEIFSKHEEQDKLDRPWRMCDKALDSALDRYRNKTVTNANKTIYTSNETTASSCDASCNRNIKNRDRYDAEQFCKTPVPTSMEQQMADKYGIKQTDKVIIPSGITHCSKVLSRLNTPQPKSAEKSTLTKEDTRRIWRNIKQAKFTYASPRERKETNVIIDESIEVDEDMIHPAISPRSNKKLAHRNDDSCDVIDTSLKDDVIPDSQNNSKPFHPISEHFSVTPREEQQLHRPLSERKKRDISQWLMMNLPDSSSDSSCSGVPPSTRNSKGSANSTLERLEQNYETPNNRERFNKAQSNRKETEIMNTNNRAIEPSLTRQAIMNKVVEKSRNENLEFKTPDRSTVSPKADNKSSTATNAPEMGINDCMEILDKLYGKSWRDKANALLPSSEPRNTSNQTMNRAVQTERKPFSKNRYYTSDSDFDESDLDKNKIRIRKKKNQRKQKDSDSFINDESLSDSGSESIYHTALTNPRTSTNSTASRPVPVSASVKRLQAICDTDSEDKSDKSSNNSRKNLNRKKLLFSDDDSDNTSEFDPGDYVPPKIVYRKETVKTPQPFKTASRFISASDTASKSFLASLSSTVPTNCVHPDAKRYRSNYKNNKEALCKELYRLYNEKVFDNKLPQEMPIEWNVRMRGTAGYCYNKKTIRSLSGAAKSSRIVLATKILDAPDRLRDTLIHEMCHAAAWLLNDVSDGHGPFWTGWANKAMKTFPELPPIRRCHDYEIKTKFTYRCTGCGYSIGRHSKSLNTERKRCGHCYGKFELLINKTTKSGTTVQVQTPKKEPSGFALYVKQNYNSVKKEKSNIRHADVMRILGQQFSAIKIASNK